MIVHQVIMGAAEGDAITSMTIRLQSALRLLGPSRIFAVHISAEMSDRVEQLLQPGTLDDADVVLYHSSMGDPRVTDRLLHLHCPLALHFHNITPHHYFTGVNETLAMSALWAREELRVLQPSVVLASADSEYNAQELEELGYQDVMIAPLGLMLDRLANLQGDSKLENELSRRFPEGYGIVVSQQLPHKRTELAVAALSLLQKVYGRKLGLVIIGGSPAPNYVTALKRFAELITASQCEFWGRTPDDELATALRGASFLLAVSDHEGLSIPPLEAMSAGVPVIARGAAAVPQTIGSGGVVLPSSAGPDLIAATINELLERPDFARGLKQRGFTRLQEISASSDPWPYLERLQLIAG